MRASVFLDVCIVNLLDSEMDKPLLTPEVIGALVLDQQRIEFVPYVADIAGAIEIVVTYEDVRDSLTAMTKGGFPYALLPLPGRLDPDMWNNRNWWALERLVRGATEKHVGTILSLEHYTYDLTRLPYECTQSWRVKWEGRIGIIFRLKGTGCEHEIRVYV
jgi:hypothetical protein